MGRRRRKAYPLIILMKTRSLAFLAAVLATTLVANAQILHTNKTASTFEVVFKSVNSTNSLGKVAANENTGAGARLFFDFNSTLGTLTVDVTNYSGYTYNSTSLSPGTLMGFGFELNPQNLTLTNFTQSLMAGLNVSGVVGAEPGGINFSAVTNYSIAGLASVDIGADATGQGQGGNPDNGLAGGFGARFVFTFSGVDTAKFNPDDFWFTNPTTTADMIFRFQATGTDRKGSDKTALYFGGNGGGEGEGDPVPEPSTYGLIGALILIGLIAKRRFAARK
jgi:hypothetical protein